MGAAKPFSASQIEACLDRLYIAAEGATLRVEDRRKAVEVAALLGEVAQLVGKIGKAQTLSLVDAASGKSYMGLLAAKLVLEPLGRPAQVLCLERNPALVAHTETAITRLDCRVPIRCVCADLAESAVWPEAPAMVLALHACGSASDEIIAKAIAVEARSVLLIPCCVGAGVARVQHAQQVATTMGIPRAAPIRRRFVHTMIESDRLLTLEAAGYQTEVVEFVAPTVTPYNVLFRARRVCEPTRMANARADLEKLWAPGAPAA